MQPPIKSWDFWVAVGVALLVKIKTSNQLGAMGVITTVLVAVGAAWVGSEYAAQLLGTPEPIAAALVTLTAEGGMRWLLIAANDPRSVLALWKGVAEMTMPWKGAACRARDQDFKAAADRIGCDVATVRAVWQVEAAGRPYRSDGTLERRFEPHKLDMPIGTWRTSLKLGAAERERLFREAYTDDAEDALRATSWGGPQIMGFHATDLGYASASDMVVAMAASEAAQIDAFARFVASKPRLASAMRSRDWQTVARIYNGNANVAVYASRMETHYQGITGRSSPMVLRAGDKGEAVRRLQVALDINVDGHFGRETEDAVRRFQTEARLKVDGKVGANTWEALEAMRGAAPVAQVADQDRIAKSVTRYAGLVGTATTAAAGVGRLMQDLGETLPESTLNIMLVGGMAFAFAALAVFAFQKSRGVA